MREFAQTTSATLRARLRWASFSLARPEPEIPNLKISLKRYRDLAQIWRRYLLSAGCAEDGYRD